MEIMKVSNQWATRPADQRFESLIAMQAYASALRNASRQATVSSRDLIFKADALTMDSDIKLIGKSTGAEVTPSHWAFGQMARIAGAPAGYLRTLPAALAADNLNYGLQVSREPDAVKLLLTNDESGRPIDVRAATSESYGRIWNKDIVDQLVMRFGDGVSGDGFRVPGEFGKRVEVTKDNTTLYMSDRDMMVFLADEEHRIDMPNRRDGKGGSLARGFIIWNSEVGNGTFGIAFFLFDYVCCNRIIWGAEQYQEFRLKHTVTAPDKWLDQIQPTLISYANSASEPVVNAITAAQNRKLEKVAEFLQERFTKSDTAAIIDAHLRAEGRPIETLWDATTGITEFAKSVPYQDERVKLEREAGKIMALAA